MKKALSILLVFCICFGMFSVVPATATGTTVDVTMGTASGKIGDTVAVDLTLNNNPGLGTLGVRVSYDATKLQLISVTDKKVFTNDSTSRPYTNSGIDSLIENNPYLIVWQDNNTLTNTTNTGKLATFNFKILAGATIGQNPITISVLNCYQANVNSTPVPTTVTSGSITAACAVHTPAASWTVTKAATCTDSGTRVKYCTVCGLVAATETIPAIGHNWGAWTVITPATFTTKGVERRICLNDASHIENRDIAMLVPVDVSMGNASGKVGDTVAVDLMLNRNPGFGTLGIIVSYDTTKLQLISVTDKKILTNGDSVKPYLNVGYDSDVTHNPYLIVWQDNLTLTNTTNTGKLATFNFKILDGATIGQNPITLTIKNCYQADIDLTTVPTVLANGYVNAQYSVNYDSQGGSTVPSVTADNNASISGPADPTKTGYTFAGWYTAVSGGTKITFPYTVTANTTMYAHWTVNNYTVSFDSNGGSVVANKTADYNTTITAPTAPTKTGYTFLGWFTALTGGTSITFPYKVTSATTMYAQWAVNNYTVTFDPNGGSAVANKTADYNTTITAPADSTKTGYTFQGWFTALTGGTKITFPYIVTANTTLYAQWVINNYTVTFDSNGGSVVASKTADYNTTITAPADPTKTGYTFQGWFTALTGGTKINFPYTVSAATTMYAQWAINNYTVTFDPNGGSTVANKTADYNTTITAPAPPTKTGYTFAGWYLAAIGGTNVTFPYTVTANTTLYAHWTVNTYSVTFDSKGGSSVTGITANYNTTFAAPADPTKTGYTFAGWYKDAGLSTAWNFASDVVVTNTTLFAKWNVNSYTVTFDSNGGSTVASKTADYNTTITAPTDPTKTGFNFAGWFTLATGGTKVTFPYTITENVTLYAQWTPIYTPGNIDGDGEGMVDLKDVTTLSRFLAGWTVDVIPEACDANGDGEVDLKDVTIISRYVAGWDVVLH